MSKFRFVLDTNLIVSAALLGHSVPRLAFELALRRDEALMSDAMQLELSEVLRRKKFDADCIATGDGDLLALNPFRGIPIVTPADFLMLYAEKM